MAIAYDNSSSVYNGTATTSQTLSHTTAGSDRILVVSTRTYDGNTITGVTYNGVAMSEVGTAQAFASNTDRHRTWILVNPASGANNVVVSLSSALRIEVYAISFTGAAQTGQPDNNNQTNGNSSSATNSLTTVADNCWSVAAMEGNGAGTFTDSTNVTLVQNIADRGCIGYGGPKTPAGSFTQAVAIGVAGQWTFKQISIAPSVAAVATGNAHNNLLLLGVT